MATKKKTPEEATPVAITSTTNFDRITKLTATMNKHYGKPLLHSGKNIPRIRKVPFGEPAIDYVYGGGAPIGRVIEALGIEHTGKTRNGLVLLGKFQKYCFGCHTPDSLTAVWSIDPKTDAQVLKSCKCTNCNEPETRLSLFIDLEGTTDPKFMEIFGIDVNGVIYSRVDLPSQAVDLVDNYIREPMIGLIIMDSVGAMGSDAEVDKAMVDIKMNQNAMFLNRAMRKWQMALNFNTNETGKENGVTVYVVNQSYQSIDIYSKEIAQGGRGLRHGKAISTKMKIIDKNIDPTTKEIKGVHLSIYNEKNKAGVPHKKAEYYLNLDKDNPLGYGMSNINMQYVDMAIKFGIVEQKGGWFYYETMKWQGKANIVQDLTQEVIDAVNRIIYEDI